jgi:hypothetical protein
MKISREIYDFLSAWDSWAESGAENGKPFWRCVGLCGNAKCIGIADAYTELSNIFATQNFNRYFPFDETAEAFLGTAEANSAHLNPARREWVKMMLASAEIEEN